MGSIEFGMGELYLLQRRDASASLASTKQEKIFVSSR
jgi:hypothetical protein